MLLESLPASSFAAAVAPLPLDTGVSICGFISESRRSELRVCAFRLLQVDANCTL
jgi:hypothetical protein